MSKRARFSILSLLVIVSAHLSWTEWPWGNAPSLSFIPSTIKPKNETIQAQENGFIRVHNNTRSPRTSDIWFQQRHDFVAGPMTTNRSKQERPAASLSDQSITILVQLSGELGNNLGKLAHGVCLQEWLNEEFQTPSTIVLRRQQHSKWIHGYRNAIQCFPFTRQFDFEAGNTPSIDSWLAKSSYPNWWETMLSVNQRGADEIMIRQALQSTVHAWRQNLANQSSTLANVTVRDKSPLSKPFILSQEFAHLHVCMDKYYDTIRTRLEFDTRACCSQVPVANETVFHFRNFLGEMVRKGKRLGFEELNPNDTAKLLFEHLREGDRVAITTRAKTAAEAQPYVEALARRNISARIITGQADVYDFCFLQQAQKELVGSSTSSFSVWAGLLNNSSAPVRLYSINSTSTRGARGNDDWYLYYNWTHPVLKERFSFPVFEQ